MSVNLKLDLKFKQMELLSEQLENLRLDKLFTDITLIDGSEVHHVAHKNILAASSTYFRDKFAAEFNLKEFKLPTEISTKAIKTLLTFSYVGILNVSTDDAEFIDQLNAASETLGFEFVTNHCAQLILEHGDFDSLWKYAVKNNKEDMKKNIAAKMAKDLGEVEQSPEFLHVSIECLELVLSQEELKLHDDDFVFKTTLKWINNDMDERVKHVKALFQNTNWDNLTTEFLNFLLENEEELMEKSVFLMKQVFSEVKKRLKNPQNARPKKAVPEPITTSVAAPINHSKSVTEPPVKNEGIRHQSSVPVVTVSANCQNRYSRSGNLTKDYDPIIEAINRRSQSMVSDRGDRNYENVPLCEMQVADTDFLKDFSENLVMVKLFEHERKIEVRNLRENKITKTIAVNGISLPFSAAVCQDSKKIYLIGGRNDCWEILSSFYSFEVKTEKWEVLAEMQIERWSAGATVINGCVYAVGGIAMENKRLNKVECYDLLTRNWKQVEDMKMCREKPAVCSHNNRVYVVGGYTVSPDQWKKSAPPETFASCEVYDLKTNQWTMTVTKMPVGRNINEKLFVTGNMDGKICALRAYSSGQFVLYIFNPETGQWIDLPARMVETELWLSIGVLKNRAICLVDIMGKICLFKSSGLRKVEMEAENGLKACYSAVFD